MLSASDKSELESTFSLVLPNLAGSSCPGLNGLTMASDVALLKSKGVVAVISLNEAALDYSILKQEMLAHMESPVKDYRPPSNNQMDAMWHFFQEHKARGVVCVHCNAGMGRTGTVLAAFMAKEKGISAEEAIKRLRQMRNGSVQTFKQENGIREWLAQR